MIDPQALYERALEAAQDFQDKEYAYGILEDGLQTLEGQIIAELRARGEPTTIVSKLAKTDRRWIEMAELRRDAEKAYKLAKFKYEQVNRFQDNIRTKETTERALAR